MAKIVFLGNFRFDFTSETHHANTLESMGHEVVRLQETVARSNEILKKAGNADLFVWVHTHGWNTSGNVRMSDVLKNLNKRGIPTMTYHLDLWFGLKRQGDLKRSPVYQDIGHFFTVDSNMADWFNTDTSVVGHYIPAGVYDAECSYTPRQKTKDIIFVGSKSYHPEWPYRPELVNWLEKTYPDSFELWGAQGKGIVRGQELNDLYASTKIVVGDTLCPNFDYPDYWSDRVYETLGRGGFLIHPYVKGMEKEFKDKEHLVFYEYGNMKQLKELIDYYLVHEDEREKIRVAGHELVKNNYTYKNRWEKILKDLDVA